MHYCVVSLAVCQQGRATSVWYGNRVLLVIRPKARATYPFSSHTELSRNQHSIIESVGSHSMGC
jgi:hypothetical protein